MTKAKPVLVGVIGFACVLACVCAFICLKPTPAKPTTLLPPGLRLLPGDLVFRQGGGFTSQVVVYADRSGCYSHVGIIVDSAGTPMVVHAVPDEPDFQGDPDRVKMDPPALFFRSDRTSIGEVCRPTNARAASLAAAEALRLYRKGIRFNHAFDAGDTTTLYCTQLIVRCYERAGWPIAGPPTHTFNLPGIHATCWLPSDLHASPCFRSVKKF